MFPVLLLSTYTEYKNKKHFFPDSDFTHTIVVRKT